ncbi:DNA polymerase/3'-5' exonuclease PolX [Candidatus Daviesbacteria bacterium]|nr:DNA polymerase/3'-5' exonuclease PolX [Candidatus Daviesbacteria bacterium]
MEKGILRNLKIVAKLVLRINPTCVILLTMTNLEVAKLLRSVAAALTLKKANLLDGNKVSLFQVRAYENAATSIENLTSEIEDLWEEDKLGDIPGVGESLKKYLNELFKNGKVEHFEKIMKAFDPIIFEFLEIPGVGPKTAEELAKYKIKSLGDLKKRLKNGELVREGFSVKVAEKILSGLEELSSRTGRMLLPYASSYADKILEYLKNNPKVLAADALGSLRRQVSTVGDLDFAASAKDPTDVINHFVKMPGITQIVDQGKSSATVVLASGLHVDLLVGKPESYGALLQHFTGSKNHNIRLRNIANEQGLSLSEYGVKNTKSGHIIPTKTEEELYKILKMDTPAPEIREDTGEIEAALAHRLPKLVEFKDIKGDLHLHSNFQLEPSHGSGANTIQDLINKAKGLGYEYVGISDHPPAFTTHTRSEIIKLIEKRTKFIHSLKKSTKNIQILNGLEIDIVGDGSLSVPDEALKTLDFCIAGIHSGHRSHKDILTKRIIKALMSPYVDIISHPSGRLLNERDSFEADWEEIFRVAAKNNKVLEINGYPNRMDLRDDLVRQAKEFEVKFVIDTDAHEVSQMENMKFGVAVARRGWAQSSDIINTWDWKKIAQWFNIN